LGSQNVSRYNSLQQGNILGGHDGKKQAAKIGDQAVWKEISFVQVLSKGQEMSW